MAARAGGVYVPPFKAARRAKEASEQEDPAVTQRLKWEALRKGINGVVNKISVANISTVLPDLFAYNLVRGRGLLARAIMKAQLASPGFTHIYAALIAVVNTRIPESGELLLKRVVIAFRRAFRRRNKVIAVALAKFVAHLVNQQVAHELLALQILSLLFARPTADSVEIAIGFTKECGQMLQEISPSGMNSVFERFRGILHSGQLDKRVQFMIEALFKCRKQAFGEFPRVLPELDLVDSEEQITHEVGLEDALDKEEALDVFVLDAAFDTNERLWRSIQSEILGDSDEEESGDDAEAVHAAAAAGGGGSPEGGAALQHDAGGSGYQPPTHKPAVVNDVSIDIPGLRRTIYLVIMSSLDFEECAHKLMGLSIPPQHSVEICNMIVECCAQERTYLKMFGLLGQRFCMMRGPWRELFEEVFAHQYSTVHSLETNKLRNVAKFFAHLLATDALPWTVFEFVRLSESETTSSSRIFLKVLLQELMQSVGMQTLRSRLHDKDMQAVFSGMLPRSNTRDTRFAINFYTTIGLGALTADLREHLVTAAAAEAAKAAAATQSSSYSSDSYSSGSYSSRSGSYSSRSGSYSSRSYSSRSRSRSYSSRSRSRSYSHSRSRSRSGSLRVPKPQHDTTGREGGGQHVPTLATH